MRVDKLFSVKIYDQNGTSFLKGFNSKRPLTNTGYLKNSVSFESRINSGFGECVLDLALPFDDFDEGTSINFMNIVRIYAVTVDHRTSPPTQSADTLIYTGFMSKYEPYLNPGGEQGVKVTLLGLVSLTALSYYKSGATFSVTHTSVDPAVIGRAIIDHVNTIYGGSLLSYSGASVDTVGASVTKVFTDRHWNEALEDTRLLSGTGWWSKIDESGVYWLKQKPSTATHQFIIGKHVEKLVSPKDSEKVVNDTQVRWNDGSADQTTNFSDATSQATYGTGSTPSGKRSTIVTDTTLNNSTAATQRGNKVIADGKDAKTKATITVNANYDLESIKVGHTCSVLNLKGSFFAANILIVSVRYNADTVDIELDDFSADFGRELTSLISSTAGSTSSSSSASGSTPGFVDRETPTGSVNGSNTAFTLSRTPIAGSEMIYLNGILQNAGGADYSISGTGITMTVAPETGASFLVSYRTANGGINFVDREVPAGSINGSNTAFVLAHTPTTGSENIYLNGILQNGAGNDYSISTVTITFVNPPESGAVLLVSYRY